MILKLNTAQAEQEQLPVELALNIVQVALPQDVVLVHRVGVELIAIHLFAELLIVRFVLLHLHVVNVLIIII